MGLKLEFENYAFTQKEHSKKGKIVEKLLKKSGLNHYGTSLVANAHVTWKEFLQFLCEHSMHAPAVGASISLTCDLKN